MYLLYCVLHTSSEGQTYDTPIPLFPMHHLHHSLLAPDKPYSWFLCIPIRSHLTKCHHTIWCLYVSVLFKPAYLLMTKTQDSSSVIYWDIINCDLLSENPTSLQIILLLCWNILGKKCILQKHILITYSEGKVKLKYLVYQLLMDSKNTFLFSL